MAFRVNGEVIVNNEGEVDAKLGQKAITDQADGSTSDVTGLDELLLYDNETGELLKVSVDEFITGADIALNGISGDSVPASIPSDTAPTTRVGGSALESGDLWYDTTELRQYTYYNDGTSTSWVPSNPETSPQETSSSFSVETDSGTTTVTSGETLSLIGSPGNITVSSPSEDVVAVSLNSNITLSGNVTAANFFGDGTNITNVQFSEEARDGRNIKLTFANDNTWYRPVFAPDGGEDGDFVRARIDTNADIGINPGEGRIRASRFDGTFFGGGTFTGDCNGTINGTLNINTLRNSQAEMNAGNLGSYAMLTLQNNNADRDANYVVGNSGLRYSNADGSLGGQPPGSWRLMGRLSDNTDNASNTSVWLRFT